jgi:hypothetical protein
MVGLAALAVVAVIAAPMTSSAMAFFMMTPRLGS